MLNKSNSRLNNRDLNNPFEMKNTGKPVLVGFFAKKNHTELCGRNG
ncbi:RNA polymerase subunit sigma-70 [Vibrio cholerae]|nr:RNA polymerase sigma-70 factor, ECF subfamily [Vibrio cholerae]KQA35787.1 RNA polymerase sigma-70 factor, ECF subfamily [Vibrio cholerae]KQA43533.1 RNA polymerase sigma-70 factor, ECF subfamily [Vibrio cholerae]KQA69727.1 RNA polymerase sigma-70 factor, ECF subfamily [Vibrio cholerae]KQA85870.1 RNA polymerase sigma-70 factor, ECF subfamily [Vibrio cholerae]